MSEWDYVGSKCQHKGCGEPAMACYLDDDLLADPRRVTEYLCGAHAVERGYCSGCGRFFAGTDSFDFLHPGTCDDCWDELRADMGIEEDAWDDDAFCEDDEP